MCICTNAMAKLITVKPLNASSKQIMESGVWYALQQSMKSAYH